MRREAKAMTRAETLAWLLGVILAVESQLTMF